MKGEPMVLVLEDGFAVQGDRGGQARDAVGERQIPCITSLDTARALVDAIAQARNNHGVPVATIAEYVRDDQTTGLPITR